MSTPKVNSVPVFPDVPPAGTQHVDALITDTIWGAGFGAGVALTYSFPTIAVFDTSRNGYGLRDNEWKNNLGVEIWQPLSGPEKAAVGNALQAWSNVANVKFMLVSDNAAVAGEIRVAKSDAVNKEGATAYAFLPGDVPIAGDVWLSVAKLDQFFNFNEDGGTVLPGSFDFGTLLHELGHALGLQHPHNDRGEVVTLAENLETMLRTVMAYEYGYSLAFQPTTPMVYDIAAIQYLYGVNKNFNRGDTVYSYDENQQYFETIWDAGGTDTIVHNGSSGRTINLGHGQASELGQVLDGVRFDPVTGMFLESFTDPRTVWIAFDVVIENAEGGTGPDVLTGNSAANHLVGNAGDDTLSGLGGNDRLQGGSGNDTMDGGSGRDDIRGNSGEDAITGGPGGDIFLFGGAGNDELMGGDGGDLLRGGAGEDDLFGGPGRDDLRGNGGDDDLNGGGAADLLRGGAGNDELAGDVGQDTLIGGEGNDELHGGAGVDTLTGDAGDDEFRFDDASGDTITDFTPSEDLIVLDFVFFTELQSTDGNPLNSNEFAAFADTGAFAPDADDRILYDQSTGGLYYDEDGSGDALEQLIVTLLGAPTISASNFIIDDSLD